MYTIRYTGEFKRQMKLCKKRGYDLSLIRNVIQTLSTQGCLPAQYRPHILSGNRKGQWECHIEPDWLMIWEQNDKELVLLMLNTGTHSDLF